MRQSRTRILRSLALMSALSSAGCAGISQPTDVSGVSKVVGPSLPGAMGKTIADQNRIDRTVARGCAGGVYGRQACERHTEASETRRKEIHAGATQAPTS